MYEWPKMFGEPENPVYGSHLAQRIQLPPTVPLLHSPLESHFYRPMEKRMLSTRSESLLDKSRRQCRSIFLSDPPNPDTALTVLCASRIGRLDQVGQLASARQ